MDGQAGSDINLSRFLQVMQARGGKSAGAIRVSTGLASNFADVERFLRFAEGLPFEQIAKHQCQSLEAVKSLFRRAMQALQNQMRDDQ